MIEFKARLESIPEDNSCISLFDPIEKQKGKNKTDEDEFEVLQPFVECLLCLEAHQDAEETMINKMAEIILVVDKSGSMQGKPWSQVQSALIKMLDLYGGKHNCRVISYNQSAKNIEITGSRSIDKFKINSIRAGGSTNFVAVFQELESIFRSQDDNTSRPYQIFFMTDGHDTCNSVKEIMVAKEHLQSEIEKFGVEVVFNVLGFSDQHDDDFLESLAMIGTSDGSYNFVSPTEGAKALEERLMLLVESASSAIGRTINIEFKGTNVEFLGEWFGTSEKEVVLPANVTRRDGSLKIITQKFVRIRNGEALNLELRVYDSLRGNATPFEANIVHCESVELKEKNDIDQHNLKKLRSAMNMITRRMGESNEPHDEETIQNSYKFIKDKMFDMKNIDTAITDIKRHHDAVSGYIKNCSFAFDQGNEERSSEKERAMSRKSAIAFNSISGGQQQNMFVQRKRLAINPAGHDPNTIQTTPSPRSKLQMKIQQTDYSVHSDED